MRLFLHTGWVRGETGANAGVVASVDMGVVKADTLGWEITGPGIFIQKVLYFLTTVTLKTRKKKEFYCTCLNDSLCCFPQTPSSQLSVQQILTKDLHAKSSSSQATL